MMLPTRETVVRVLACPYKSINTPGGAGEVYILYEVGSSCSQRGLATVQRAPH